MEFSPLERRSTVYTQVSYSLLTWFFASVLPQPNPPEDWGGNKISYFPPIYRGATALGGSADLFALSVPAG
ncbi:MAG: hypothetical protein V7L29_17885 [Nostoc sp.]|uniref:hypothetical protein n=1 Tax=Nostoc sp. TaxID=1180 RepID=UPI002FF42364